MSQSSLPAPILPNLPLTALAPMQDVTTLPFMSVISSFGPPDYFFTEYFRVHDHSNLEPFILDSITKNPSSRPVFAQLIGEDPLHMVRTAKELQNYPIAGIDLNMGCPAPRVYKKNVGGGLLRDPKVVDNLLGTMRENIPGLFTVKMRIGFEDTRFFDDFLNLINKHKIDLLSLHGRTVKEMYRSEVHYDEIKYAVNAVKCPVFANGNITSYEKAEWTINHTGAFGVMIGRSAIRNPWIFLQTRQHFAKLPIFIPKLQDVFDYITALYNAIFPGEGSDSFRCAYMKKFLNFVGQGVDPEGLFLKEMRRAQSSSELFAICKKHLISDDKAALNFATEPYEGVIARPNCELPIQTCSF